MLVVSDSANTRRIILQGLAPAATAIAELAGPDPDLEQAEPDAADLSLISSTVDDGIDLSLERHSS